VIAHPVGLAVGTHEADAESVALFGGELRLVIPAPRLVVVGNAVFACEQVPSVQFLKTLVYVLAVDGRWHANLPPSGFSCTGFRILQHPSARCAHTTPDRLGLYQKYRFRYSLRTSPMVRAGRKSYRAPWK
jgi:hypothetical protein